MGLGLLSSTQMDLKLTFVACRLVSFCQVSCEEGAGDEHEGAQCALVLCRGSLKSQAVVNFRTVSTEICLQVADLGFLNHLASSIAANTGFILPYLMLSFPPRWLGSHPSMTAEQTNPNAGQNCCSARRAILFSLGS